MGKKVKKTNNSPLLAIEIAEEAYKQKHISFYQRAALAKLITRMLAGGTTMVKVVTIRRAIANYMRSEGCSCCQDYDNHEKYKARIGKLLNVPKYSDDSGYDFSQFRSKDKK